MPCRAKHYMHFENHSSYCQYILELLDELEKDLKKMIEERNNVDTFQQKRLAKDLEEKANILARNAPTYMAVKEHGQPYSCVCS